MELERKLPIYFRILFYNSYYSKNNQYKKKIEVRRGKLSKPFWASNNILDTDFTVLLKILGL